jgi:hypothetical protein
MAAASVETLEAAEIRTLAQIVVNAEKPSGRCMIRSRTRVVRVDGKAQTVVSPGSG